MVAGKTPSFQELIICFGLTFRLTTSELNPTFLHRPSFSPTLRERKKTRHTIISTALKDLKIAWFPFQKGWGLLGLASWTKTELGISLWRWENNWFSWQGSFPSLCPRSLLQALLSLPAWVEWAYWDSLSYRKAHDQDLLVWYPSAPCQAKAVRLRFAQSNIHCSVGHQLLHTPEAGLSTKESLVSTYFSHHRTQVIPQSLVLFTL